MKNAPLSMVVHNFGSNAGELFSTRFALGAFVTQEKVFVVKYVELKQKSTSNKNKKQLGQTALACGKNYTPHQYDYCLQKDWHNKGHRT